MEQGTNDAELGIGLLWRKTLRNAPKQSLTNLLGNRPLNTSAANSWPPPRTCRAANMEIPVGPSRDTARMVTIAALDQQLRRL